VSTDTRDARAIRQIDCPRCGAEKGQQCGRSVFDLLKPWLMVWQPFQTRDGRPACCTERRKANQERLRAVENIAKMVLDKTNRKLLN
jgi:hypothetical protein